MLWALARPPETEQAGLAEPPTYLQWDREVKHRDLTWKAARPEVGSKCAVWHLPDSMVGQGACEDAGMRAAAAAALEWRWRQQEGPLSDEWLEGLLPAVGWLCCLITSVRFCAAENWARTPCRRRGLPGRSGSLRSGACRIPTYLPGSTIGGAPGSLTRRYLDRNGHVPSNENMINPQVLLQRADSPSTRHGDRDCQMKPWKTTSRNTWAESHL